ncbi:Flp family type IVb pilin [Filobacillus milosensis]|uniref:Flp family type IVb pilin n=2 Tax=Filobacillus milosensis TaxID=94137 RepID=A0A4Y8IIX9_9BACI|nr:Flp family type IVb pilin [Filobacillus milosensis]
MNFLREEEGQGMAEYALVLGVIAVGVVAVLATFSGEIINVFNDVIAGFTTEPDTGTP